MHVSLCNVFKKNGIWAGHFQMKKNEFEIVIKWIIHRSYWVRLYNGGLMQPSSTIFQ